MCMWNFVVSKFLFACGLSWVESSKPSKPHLRLRRMVALTQNPVKEVLFTN
jgi:hypothetical protein